MEQYLRRNRLSDLMDGIGMAALLYLLGLGGFTWLWGLNVPSILAGLSLGTLLWAARCQWRRRTVARREKALRSRIGAELMLEAMLFSEAKEAHFRAALLLAEKWPVVMQSVKEEGVLCRQGEEQLLIQCLRMPEEGELSMSDLLAAQRAAKRMQANRAVFCVLGKVSPKIAAKAERALTPLRIIRRETLLELAGRYAPATDEQLIELGRRRGGSGGRSSMIRLAFHPDKAKRYHLYGQMMLILYLLTGTRLYAVPGMTCLAMAVMSRWGRKEREQL